MNTVHAELDSPIGPIRLAATDEGLTQVHFGALGWRGVTAPALVPLASQRVLAQAAEELSAYFAHQLTAFSVPLAPRGTAFQRAVWAALRAIPCGETRAYRDIAQALGRPTATRAVGAANGQNPIGIIQPCHRVIGADGSLTGFAGGLDAKRWLLAHERPWSVAPGGGRVGEAGR